MLYLSLGTNLGNRLNNLKKATLLINQRIGKVIAEAKPIETMPVGFLSDNVFLNSALAVETQMKPQEVLQATQTIEREMGRTVKSKNGIYHDRIIDIDILVFDDICLEEPMLTIPHPRIYDRLFVLEPLAQIAPDLVLPVYGQAVKELLQARQRCYILPLNESLCTADVLAAFNSLLSQLSTCHEPLSADKLRHLAQENNPDSTIYLLFDNATNRPIATATLSVSHLLTGTKAWIEDVVVDSNFRSQGFARTLLYHLIFQAHRLHADSLNLTSRPSRLAANKLYQSMGFERRETNVYKMDMKEG